MWHTGFRICFCSWSHSLEGCQCGIHTELSFSIIYSKILLKHVQKCGCTDLLQFISEPEFMALLSFFILIIYFVFVFLCFRLCGGSWRKVQLKGDERYASPSE